MKTKKKSHKVKKTKEETLQAVLYRNGKKKKTIYGWETYELTSFIKLPNKDCGGVNYQFKALWELCFNNMSLTL